MIATARLVLARSRVRLSAGRQELSREAQMLCFVAGANSIFYGDRLLMTGNPDAERDHSLLRSVGSNDAQTESGIQSGPAGLTTAG